MQSVTIEGYLAAAPSILAAQSDGKKRASFRVLEAVRFRRGDGELGERITGFNCVCFNERTAEDYIAVHARKGSRVVVHGHVENDNWTGTDGVAHYDLRLVVESLRIKSRAGLKGDEEIDDSARDGTLASELDQEIPF
jgi:single-strand DNA-binding protein